MFVPCNTKADLPPRQRAFFMPGVRPNEGLPQQLRRGRMRRPEYPIRPRASFVAQGESYPAAILATSLETKRLYHE